MSFSAFSKEFTSNMFTSVENQFITKYLPQADGDAVRAYLYGLYLCGCKEDFDGESMAKLLKIPYPKLLDIFGFWEECDLVHILSREPLLIEYLPVNAAVGKPKSIRPEKYAEFNREIYKLLQKANKDFKPYEMQRILEFLENNPIEQQAFLLVFEYCAKKDGDKLSCAHVLNKAKQLCAEHHYTYEQVERALSDFNRHERDLEKIFSLLGIYRKPQQSDYDYLEKWLAQGFESGALFAMAETLKKGTPATLDALAEELLAKDVRTAAEAKEYLAQREELAGIVFRVARKLGVKIQNPRAYIEEYAEKWSERGYDEESLLSIAGLCFKIRYAFPEMDTLIDGLYRDGVVDEAGVKNYCAAREKQLRLLQTIQTTCGVIKKTQSALDMIQTWQSWNFSDAMILEAAKRSSDAANPLSYMNKLLSEWKRTGISSPSAVPERHASPARNDFRSEAAIAADLRTDRETYYAQLRQKAAAEAERARRVAERDDAFRKAESDRKKSEIELAKAELYSPSAADEIRARLISAQKMRAEALSRLGLKEEDLEPKCQCKKCSDTGFLPDGRACDCYPMGN